MSTWSIDEEDSSWVGNSWARANKLSELEYAQWSKPNQKEYDKEIARQNTEQAPDYDPWTDSYY